MSKLEGKVAIITGSARGMGAAHARLFRSEGAVVYATDVLVEEGNALASEIECTFVQHDVSSEAAWSELVDPVVAEHGRVDVLVNNAGIIRLRSLTETSVQLWRE